ncbi:hypothetical protein J27TS8_24190 [Robertmurraya siralis]|uniref:Uncharacterized protein n=1 Tax=Robertmurraya siralis TaxID=77777 RepID=A0A919WI33_9BACI|nr:hypothetical protein CHH80_11340 [Bacillus sp. 7504-2]GIN62426.1 hypothetical protein J27TS8_24190 [Robertmurraya siralis]
MKDSLLMSLCVLYIQNGWDPHVLSNKYGVTESQIGKYLSFLIEKKIIFKISGTFIYILPEEGSYHTIGENRNSILKKEK